MFFHTFSVALIVAAFGRTERELTAPVVVIEQHFADSSPGGDILCANVPGLGVGNIFHPFFLIPAQVDGDFIAIVLGGGFRHAVEQEKSIAFPCQMVGFVDFSVTVELIVMPGIDAAAVRAADPLTHRGPAFRLQTWYSHSPWRCSGPKGSQMRM